MTHESDDAGWGNPPTPARFQPGRSGNPAGRPKGLRNMATELRQILAEQISIRAEGQLKRVTKQHALASALVTAAIEGDLRATAIVMNHLHRSSLNGSGDEDIDFSAIEAHRKPPIP